MRSRRLQFGVWLLLGVVTFGGLVWDSLTGYGPVLIELSEKVRTLIVVSVVFAVILYGVVFLLGWLLASRHKDFLSVPGREALPSHIVAGLVGGGASVVWMVVFTLVGNWLLSDQGIEMRDFTTLTSVFWYAVGIALGLTPLVLLVGVGGVRGVLGWFGLPEITRAWAGVATSAFLFVMLVATPAVFPEYVEPNLADYLSIALVYGVPALLASFIYWRRSLLSGVIVVGVFTLVYDIVLGIVFGFSLLS